MKKVYGDLLKLFNQSQFDVIIHGCNCGCNMGAGIAKAIAEEFPEAYHADLATPKFDKGKLGTYSYADIWVDVDTPDGPDRIFLGRIINAYTQFHWRSAGAGGKPLCDYEALRKVFMSLKKDLGGKGLRFGLPAIGAARAGGDWSIISQIIDEELHDEDVTFVEFNGVDPKGDYRKHMST